MTGVPLGLGAFNRTYGQEPEVQLINRFVEAAPANQIEQTVLLSRPGSSFLTGAGSGPIRKIKSQPGVFDNDLFYVSDRTLYRYDGVTTQAITGTVALGATPAMTFVSGADYEHLFISDGTLLQFYPGLSKAVGVLTLAGAIVAAETVTVDTAYYEFTAGSVDTGTPAGTISDPFLVAMGGSDTVALENLIKALNLTGIAGTNYSTATIKNVNVEGVTSAVTTLNVKARVAGTAGNSIATTETLTNGSWAAATLEGGGVHALSGVATPDDVAIVSLTSLASFVLAVVANSRRFFWILPAEITIDPLNFASAESEPDEITEVVRVGDVVYMVGNTSTEVWYANANAQTASDSFLRNQGFAFSQGALEGTVVSIRTQIVMVAEDGKVYEVAGGPKRISNNGIEERIRLWRAAKGV